MYKSLPRVGGEIGMGSDGSGEMVKKKKNEKAVTSYEFSLMNEARLYQFGLGSPPSYHIMFTDCVVFTQLSDIRRRSAQCMCRVVTL